MSNEIGNQSSDVKNSRIEDDIKTRTICDILMMQNGNQKEIERELGGTKNGKLLNAFVFLKKKPVSIFDDDL